MAVVKRAVVMRAVRPADFADRGNDLPCNADAVDGVVCGWVAMVSQKHGISALGLKRALGTGSEQTAWAMLHRYRTAMVRPGRERLSGLVEVDARFWVAPIRAAGTRGDWQDDGRDRR